MKLLRRSPERNGALTSGADPTPSAAVAVFGTDKKPHLEIGQTRTNARPTILLPGTKPLGLESSERLRWSPMTQ